MGRNVYQKMPLVAVLAIVMSPLTLSASAYAENKSMSNHDWWPERLDLQPLRQQDAESSPMDEDFNYAEAFKTLDLDTIKKKLKR